MLGFRSILLWVFVIKGFYFRGVKVIDKDLDFKLGMCLSCFVLVDAASTGDCDHLIRTLIGGIKLKQKVFFFFFFFFFKFKFLRDEFTQSVTVDSCDMMQLAIVSYLFLFS